MPLSATSFAGSSPQIEFTNNTIKIRKDDPFKKRDRLILNSWTGALLALCSIVCTLFSMMRLLPAVYGSGCHAKKTWSMSVYPGATFAIVESLTSISCLVLLALAGLLTFALDYIPRFFLRTLPKACSICRRKMGNACNPSKKWKPNQYTVDLLGETDQ